MGINDHHRQDLTRLQERLSLPHDILKCGLSTSMVNNNKTVYGPNVFTQTTKTHPIIKFMKMYLHPFNILLLFACVLALILYGMNLDDRSNLYLGLGILSVSIFNTCLEFYQEYKTNEMLSGFKNLVPNSCSVLRNSKITVVKSSDVVVGDVVYLKMGDKVGADIRLFEANNLSVDNSSLTGESDPIKKSAKTYLSEELDMKIVNQENKKNTIDINSPNMINNNLSPKVTTNRSDQNVLGNRSTAHISIMNNINCDSTSSSPEMSEDSYEKKSSNIFKNLFWCRKSSKRQSNIDFYDNLYSANNVESSTLSSHTHIVDINTRINQAHYISNEKSTNQENILSNDEKEEPENSEYYRANNMVFSGDLVTAGTGTGIVVSTGDRTVLGKIAKLTVEKSPESNELSAEINQYVQKLGFIAVLTCIIFYAVAMLNNFNFKDNLVFCIGIFIAFVPQGLPATVTILLTIAAKRMAKNNVLVKDLRAVETLGSISLLATDKTGTLTQGIMKCNSFWDGENVNQIYDEKHKINKNTVFRDTCVSCYISSAAMKLDSGEIRCDPTEKALYDFSTSYLNVDADAKQMSKSFHKIYELPFDSENKFQISIFKHVDGFKFVVKGAPDRILKKCGFYTSKNKKVDDAFSQKLHVMYENFASNGQRVIAVAENFITNTEFCEKYASKIIKKNLLEKAKEICHIKQLNIINFQEDNQKNESIDEKEEDENSNINKMSNYTQKISDILKILKTTEWQDFLKEVAIEMDNFVFLCLIGIIDPPKIGVRNAVMKLRLAGIQVVMVTGDHPLTAKYIAKKIYLISGKTREEAAKALNKDIKDVQPSEYEVEIIHGDEIDNLKEEEWERIVSKNEIVFARTSPKQKMVIVENFQKHGHIVGVSGDGVNDSPALKKAHLGISMNQTGSEVSKEAAHMIILDDNFSSIVNGVLEGRLIFSNLKKSIRYILSHITPQVVPFILYVTFGIPSPMSALLLMLIDLFTEFFPSVALAWEHPEGNLMLELPRKSLSRKSPNSNILQITGNNDENLNTKENNITTKLDKNDKKYQCKRSTSQKNIGSPK
ncbi:HAD ATPase, P-type, family IC [Edhazardia aedis USNM 41457]|uniref:HAD ATPase, P-type, family IC n=1 Tax=Edhazardia aedis (strain USNM 41457) TaxID=1003232 RepID=J8ZP06_EDHAE|nr:HAD ATPase, P-type, family IC [Edhazardia aedis USNM 41457]|eukprot:EJW01433.1 HAD ATPase, P-type, family IC [Edhazardia aedis USNM 41457]